MHDVSQLDRPRVLRGLREEALQRRAAREDYVRREEVEAPLQQAGASHVVAAPMIGEEPRALREPKPLDEGLVRARAKDERRRLRAQIAFKRPEGAVWRPIGLQD